MHLGIISLICLCEAHQCGFRHQWRGVRAVKTTQRWKPHSAHSGEEEMCATEEQQNRKGIREIPRRNSKVRSWRGYVSQSGIFKRFSIFLQKKLIFLLFCLNQMRIFAQIAGKQAEEYFFGTQ